jgi:hypothetical protein
MRSVSTALASALLLAASKSSEVTAAYVSPLIYQNHTCQQLAMEA